MSRAGKPRRPPLRSGGFTLLELLVVLGIAGLVLTAAPPLLSALLPTFHVKSAARDVATELRSARSAAIAARRETALLFDPIRQSFGPVGATASPPPHVLPAGVRLVEAAVPDAQRDAGGLRIRFFPDGSSTGGRIRLAQGNRQADVRVDWLTGRVSLDDR